mgnify:CR=1 FL=1
MTIKQNKLLKISLVFLLLFILIVQGLKSREIVNKKELLQFEISAQQQQNSNLQNKYSNHSRSSNLSIKNQSFDLKEKTAAILSELQNFNLELIDFSSSKAELNLNLSGDFNSILNFIYYLENQIESLKIEEFKIKKNRNKLFFFVKLKNELI